MSSEIDYSAPTFASRAKGIIEIFCSDETAKMISMVIETRKVEAEFKHKIEQVLLDYEALGHSHDKMTKDRDGDREGTLTIIRLMAECGMQHEIPGVWQAYLERAPRYSDAVVEVILSGTHKIS